MNVLHTSAPLLLRNWRTYVVRPGWWVNAVPVLVLIVVLAWAFFPALFTNFSPVSAADGAGVFEAPSFAHLFGTDHLARDVFTRIVYGTAETVTTSGVAVLVGLSLGTVIGGLTAVAGRVVEIIGMRLIDVLIALPSFLISIYIITAFGRGPWTLAIGVGISSISLFARVARAEVLRVRNYDFVEASLLAGSGFWAVLFRRILPNAFGPLLALAIIDFGLAILSISALGFLGLGSPPPEPEWGLIVAEGRAYLGTSWWITLFPGLVITVAVLSAGSLGRRLNHRVLGG